ncbi:uncharacterized protein [Nicotiana tomentosiformis]|uniref:uncharacterized protein n=1 Tax=Nicotiana tomentosiformis TaxID=4098 RepID=UPI00388CBBE6
MVPKKKARIGQRANATLGVAIDPIPDDVDCTISYPAEGVTISPPTDTPVPPLASASGSIVFDGDLRGAIQMLAQIVFSQAHRLNVAPTSFSQPGVFASSRVNMFLQLDPPVFTGTNPEEDPWVFIDEMHKTLRVMCATETEAVELASYRLKEVPYSWFELCEESREEGSPPSRWSEFFRYLH